MHFTNRKVSCALAESVKRAKFCMTILRHVFYLMLYEKIRRVEEKDGIWSKVVKIWYFIHVS
jgi:hypothetical protein